VKKEDTGKYDGERKRERKGEGRKEKGRRIEEMREAEIRRKRDRDKRKRKSERQKGERRNDEEERVGGREEAAGPGPEGLPCSPLVLPALGNAKEGEGSRTRGREVGSGEN